MTYKDYIPTRIKAARESVLINGKKMTQQDLAERISIDPQMISYYEKGSKTPPLDRLAKIAETLNRPISWLLGEDQTEAPKIRSYADILRALDSMEYAFQSQWEQFADEETVEEPYDGPTHYFRNAYIKIGVPAFFEKKMSDWQTMRKLLGEGTIDKEIYDTWHSKLLQELDSIPLDEMWREL